MSRPGPRTSSPTLTSAPSRADREAARAKPASTTSSTLLARPRASLFVIGDLFDFWFEYRTAIPRRHFQTLCALRRVRDAGVEITYLTGNHDFWLGRFLEEELGHPHPRRGRCRWSSRAGGSGSITATG